MKQDKGKLIASDEKLVLTKDRVPIGDSNLRIDPFMTKREETFQVVLDILKNTSFYNAFLISANVPEIYMQQFWLTVQKVKKSSSYQFILDHKTCLIDVDIFKEILDISPTTVVDDCLLERLKFINKGDPHQIYGKPIPSAWITNEIRSSKAYQMYFKYSIGIIPPKISRGRAGKEVKKSVKLQKTTLPKKKPTKETKATKERAAPRKAITSLKKTPTKRKKKRTPRAVVIQEPSSVPKKLTQESSDKLKGIDMLLAATQLKFDTQKAIKMRVPDESTGKSVISDEGAGTKPEVPGEKEYKNEENKEDEDDEEDEDDDNRIFDITDTDDERTGSDEESQGLTHSEAGFEENAKEEEEPIGEHVIKEKEEEQQGDDRVKEAQVAEHDIKEHTQKISFLHSTSSRSLFLEPKVISMMDIPIQQEVLVVQQETYHVVSVSFIPESTHVPPPPSPLTSAVLTSQVPNTEAVSSVVQRLTKMEEFVKELKEADFGAIIHDSIQSQVLSIVNKYLGSIYPDEFRKILRSNNAKLKKELSELD
nr:hypothetical protein [Tanacetum cinerariifolium]